MERTGKEKVERSSPKCDDEGVVGEFLYERGFTASYQSACPRACERSFLPSPSRRLIYLYDSTVILNRASLTPSHTTDGYCNA